MSFYKKHYNGNFYSKLGKATALGRRNQRKSGKYGVSRIQRKSVSTSDIVPDIKRSAVFADSPMKRSKGYHYVHNTAAFQSPIQDMYYPKNREPYSQRKAWYSPLERIESPLAFGARSALIGYQRARRAANKLKFY